MNPASPLVIILLVAIGLAWMTAALLVGVMRGEARAGIRVALFFGVAQSVLILAFATFGAPPLIVLLSLSAVLAGVGAISLKRQSARLKPSTRRPDTP